MKDTKSLIQKLAEDKLDRLNPVKIRRDWVQNEKAVVEVFQAGEYKFFLMAEPNEKSLIETEDILEETLKELGFSVERNFSH